MKMLKAQMPRTSQEPAATLQKALPKAPHAAAGRAANLGSLVGESASRAATSASAAGAVFAIAPTAQTWGEWFALQTATAQRFRELQQSLWQGWGVWLQELSELRRANTLSEFTEQQYNLCAQLGALAKDHVSDLLSLQSNVEVDCGYWAARKLQG